RRCAIPVPRFSVQVRWFQVRVRGFLKGMSVPGTDPEVLGQGPAVRRRLPAVFDPPTGDRDTGTADRRPLTRFRRPRKKTVAGLLAGLVPVRRRRLDFSGIEPWSGRAGGAWTVSPSALVSRGLPYDAGPLTTTQAPF